MINKKGAGSLTSALTIVLSINMLLWFGQIAVYELNPEGSTFFHNKDTLLDKYDAGNYTLDDNAVDQLPSSESSVSVTTGNIFSDLFTTVKNWFLDSTGFSYILNVLSAPMSFLRVINLPQQFAFGIGAMWYGITLFLVIAFIRGDSG